MNAFSVLTLLVDHQEWHLVNKKYVKMFVLLLNLA